MEFINFTLVAWQYADHGFTLGPQRGNSAAQICPMAPGRTDHRPQRTRTHRTHHLLKIQTETHCRADAAALARQQIETGRT